MAARHKAQPLQEAQTVLEALESATDAEQHDLRLKLRALLASIIKEIRIDPYRVEGKTEAKIYILGTPGHHHAASTRRYPLPTLAKSAEQSVRRFPFPECEIFSADNSAGIDIYEIGEYGIGPTEPSGTRATGPQHSLTCRKTRNRVFEQRNPPELNSFVRFFCAKGKSNGISRPKSKSRPMGNGRL